MTKKGARIAGTGIERAALYIRVSTEEQAMHGLSLKAQRETLTQYVQNNGLKLAGIYTDGSDKIGLNQQSPYSKGGALI